MIQKCKNYLSLIRFFNPTGTFLLLYPIIITFLFIDPNFTHFNIFILFLLGAFLMRSAGCIINDLCDYKYDKRVLRTKNRPLASGAVNKIEALFLLVILLLMSLAILLQFNPKTILFGFVIIIPVVIYPLTKRFFKYPQIFLGGVFNLGVFLLYFALNKDLNIIPFILYIAFLSWTVAYDTIYAYQDINDDIILGLNSTAINWGNNSRIIVSILYIVFLLLLLLVGILNGYGFFFYILLNIITLIVLAKISFLNLDDDNECKRFFQFNNIIGLSIILAILLS